MPRWKAALIHLSISATVALIASILLLLVWYPPPYFHAAGGERLLLLVTCVDVTLGPLLTFVVFRSGKPGLRFDLACIGTMQAIALVYGFHVMLASRPVFMVAAVDRFVLVAANEVSAKDLAAASQPQWRHLSWTGPVLVGSAAPKDAKARNALLFSGLAGKDIERFPRYYVDYPTVAHDLLQRALPIAQLRRMHPSRSADITDWLNAHGRTDGSVVWLPIVARDKDLCMLMDKTTGQPLGAVAMDPWNSDAPAAPPVTHPAAKP